MLLALMCQRACESSQFVLFMEDDKHEVVELSSSDILEKTASLVSLATAYLSPSDDQQATIPEKVLQSHLVDRTQVSDK